MALKHNYKEFDDVVHPILGNGYVDRVILNEKGVPTWLSIEWDDDPPEHFNMGENPSIELTSEVLPL